MRANHLSPDDNCQAARPCTRVSLLERWAKRHRLCSKRDDDGTEIVSGRHGQIYKYDAQHLGAMVIHGYHRARYWTSARKRLAAVGMMLVQNGDAEGAAIFDPADPRQSRTAVQVIGVRRKKAPSAAQLEVLNAHQFQKLPAMESRYDS